MLKFEPSKTFTEVENAIEGYRKRLDELKESKDRLQDKINDLNKNHQEALVKQEVGEEVDLEKLRVEIKNNKDKLVETKQRIAALENALDPKNISNAIPRIAELLRVGENEYQEFSTQCSNDIKALEEKLIKAKASYLDIIAEIGRIRGVEYQYKQELNTIMKDIMAYSGRGAGYPQFITYGKPWIIKEEDIHNAFKSGASDVK